MIINEVSRNPGAVHLHSGMSESYGMDPATNMQRPRSISVTGSGWSWSTGTYQYDGAGNIKQIGASESFVYDKVSRLTSGTVLSNGIPLTQAMTYDAFGNILSSTVNGVPRTFAVDPARNRVSGFGYDAAGNQTSWGDGGTTYNYTYNPFNQMQSITAAGINRNFQYTADGERVELRDVVGCGFVTGDGCDRHLFIRDLAGKVLRVYSTESGFWSWEEDYVYRDGKLLATETPTAHRHMHPDHLGSVRRVGRHTTGLAGYLDYYPFGVKAGSSGETTDRMKFTGHERDDQGTSGSEVDDLDYMHARYYNPNIVRFTSVDPGRPRKPGGGQQWNAYAYVQNNPLRFTDPTGKDLYMVFDFRGSGLTSKQQIALALAIRQRYLNAGVKNVYVLSRGGSTIPSRSQLGKHDSLVDVKVAPLDLGKNIYGLTNVFSQKAQVSTKDAPAGQAGMTFLVNVTAHEVGHGSKALTAYDADRADPGSFLHPRPAQPGTLMQTRVPASELSGGLREFSVEDAAALQDRLNEPGQ